MPKSRRYIVVVFSYLLDTCRNNASTVRALNKQQDSTKMDSFAFGMNVKMKLVLPFVECQSRNGLTINIVQKIKLVLGEFSMAPSLSIGILTPFTPILKDQQCGELSKLEITGKRMKARNNKLPKLCGQCQMCSITECLSATSKCR